MSKCYIVQEVNRRDHESGQMVPTMDFSGVLEYGEPVVCLPGGRVGLSPGPTLDRLRKILMDFSDDDYLVPVGDPTAMAMAAMIAAEMNRGRVKILKWEREERRYIMIQVDLHYRTRRAA